MDRQVPAITNNSINLYSKTYYSLLRSSAEIAIRSLEETHAAMKSSLHQQAGTEIPDIGAFGYAWARLPACMVHVERILLGQTIDVFAHRAGENVEDWEMVESKARRRHAFFDGESTLAALISSASDIDDLIPMVTAYQIEWNKLHQAMQQAGLHHKLKQLEKQGIEPGEDILEEIQQALKVSDEDFNRLISMWKNQQADCLRALAYSRKNISVRLLAGSLSDYRKASQGWWRNMVNEVGDIFSDRPVYFVSSNAHVMPNQLSGYSRQVRDELLSYVKKTQFEGLHLEAEEAQQDAANGSPGRLENLLYYALRARQGDKNFRSAMAQHDQDAGVFDVESFRTLDIDAQVVEVNRLKPENLDPRLRLPGLEKLRKSNAVILNIDYPLGMAAYHVMSQVAANVERFEGVYIMGKAATLNGRVGDVMIPNVVFDQHSKNTYLFRNCLTSVGVTPYLRYGTVLDNQKSMTVRGTFLQNPNFMHVFYNEGYTDIEMEAGPYLSAIYENVAPKRYPANEIVNLFLLTPYELGFLHYASDTPISRRQELLSRSLSYFGMDSTYACSTAIFRRILEREISKSS